jgi:hypothetical protein
MFLRILDFAEFECLVVIADADYYDKKKRWGAYAISKILNNNIDEIDIKFSLMPFSEQIVGETITAEGFCFKYATKA